MQRWGLPTGEADQAGGDKLRSEGAGPARAWAEPGGAGGAAEAGAVPAAEGEGAGGAGRGGEGTGLEAQVAEARARLGRARDNRWGQGAGC
jgi:hypothetical protein